MESIRDEIDNGKWAVAIDEVAIPIVKLATWYELLRRSDEKDNKKCQ